MKRLLYTAVALPLMMATLVPPTMAEEAFFRTQLPAPILFTGVTDAPAFVDIEESRFRNGASVAIPVTVEGMRPGYAVALSDAPDGWSWDDEAREIVATAAGAGTVRFAIEMRDSAGDLVASRDVAVDIVGPLSASVTPATVEVAAGDEVEVLPVADNLVGDPVWSFGDPDLDLQGLSFDAATGRIHGTAAEGLQLTDVTMLLRDMGDEQQVATNPFTIRTLSEGGGTWFAALGGGDSDFGASVAATPTGVVVAGYTKSIGNGDYDILIVHFLEDGSLDWAYTLGGSKGDRGFDVKTTSDGIVLGGETESIGAGSDDVLVAKFGFDGSLSWAKTLGGTGSDSGLGLAVTADGFAIVGSTTSGVTSTDVLVAHFKSDGSLDWAKTLGGGRIDVAEGIVATSDGLVVNGYSDTGYGNDMLVAQFELDGTFGWAKIIGGDGSDMGRGGIVAVEGGVLVSGSTDTDSLGTMDVLVAHFDSAGNLGWSKALRGTGVEYGYDLVETNSGFALSGYTNSAGSGVADHLLVGFTGNGDVEWARAIGGNLNEYGMSLVRTSGGFAIAGSGVSPRDASRDLVISQVSDGDLGAVGEYAEVVDVTSSFVLNDTGWVARDLTSLPKSFSYTQQNAPANFLPVDARNALVHEIEAMAE